MSSKKEFRKRYKTVLAELSEHSFNKKSELIGLHTSKFLASLPEHFSIIGGFAPMTHLREVNWPSAYDFKRGDLSFPSWIEGNEMCFKLSELSELEKKKEFGTILYAPKKSAKIVVPKVLLVPGIAFSRKGERLGRGGGYYDRYLKNFSGLKIGICFSEQLVPELPIEDHDERMNLVISEKGIEFNDGTLNI